MGLFLTAEDIQFLVLLLLGVFVAAWLLLKRYAVLQARTKSMKDACSVLVPLVAIAVFIADDAHMVVFTAISLALVEMLYYQKRIKVLARNLLWFVALIPALAYMAHALAAQDIQPLAFLLAIALVWYLSAHAFVGMSGRRQYDPYLFVQFAVMHAIAVFALPQIENAVGIALLAIAVVMLMFGVLRDKGLKLPSSQALLAFSSAWFAYIWVQMAMHGLGQVLLVLLAYPVLSRLVGKLDKNRHFGKSQLGNAVVVFGAGLVTACALLLCSHFLLTQAQGWYLVAAVYILEAMVIMLGRKQHPQTKQA